MLSSVLDMYEEIVALLGEERMGKVEQRVLKWLTGWLLEFKVETKTLEGDGNGHPTLPYVLLVATGLRDHCVPSLEDNPHLLVLKERCLELLGRKFVPTMKAKVATFLWPDFKSLVMLSTEEREEVKANVRAMIGQESVEDADVPPPPKVLKTDKYKRYRQGAATTTDEPLDEVSRYMAMSTASVPAELLLQHWKLLDRPDALPRLAQLARRELAKSATAAASERVWSKAGFILNSRRNRLSAAHMRSIIFVNSFLRNKKAKAGLLNEMKY